MRSPAAHVDTRLTYDDFVQFPDDGNRHELIDGEHYVTPSPEVRHQAIVVRLVLAIGNHLQANPHLGRVFVAPLDVVLSNHDIVEPDVLFVATDQTEILTEKNVQGPPALVIEVLSHSTRKRDAQAKRRLFERTGVREYLARRPRTRHGTGAPSVPRRQARARRRTCGGRRRDADHAAAARVRHLAARPVRIGRARVSARSPARLLHPASPSSSRRRPRRRDTTRVGRQRRARCRRPAPACSTISCSGRPLMAL